MCQVVAYRRLKTIDNSKLSVEKVVAIAYGRWSFTRDSSIRLWLIIFLVFRNWGWSLMGGGRLREVVARGGSTVLCFRFGSWKVPRRSLLIRCPREVWERASGDGDVTAHGRVQEWSSRNAWGLGWFGSWKVRPMNRYGGPSWSKLR